jgi:hypothetical protein
LLSGFVVESAINTCPVIAFPKTALGFLKAVPVANPPSDDILPPLPVPAIEDMIPVKAETILILKYVPSTIYTLPKVSPQTPRG